jgi:hypothetical protein
MNDAEWRTFRTAWQQAWRTFDRSTAFGCRLRNQPYNATTCERNRQRLDALLTPDKLNED